MMPLDGLPVSTGLVAQQARRMLPAGRDEVPHCCYLLTLHPLMLLITNVCFYAQ